MASTSRYQSKIFNFVSEQSRKLSQQIDHTLKGLQIATKLGVDSLLQSLYQIITQKEPFGKQLNPGSPVETDTPIQEVLTLVKNLPTGTAEQKVAESSTTVNFWKFLWKIVFPNHTQDNTTPRNILQEHLPKIQGIATLLDNRNLVLVGEDNRVFNVLSPSQNREITNKINYEIETYQQLQLLPAIDRTLNKLTANYPQNRFLGFVDNLVANVENYVQNSTLVPGKEVKNYPFSEIVAEMINYFLGGRNIAPEINQNVINSVNIRNTNIPQLPKSDITDIAEGNWLSWNDLFGKNNNSLITENTPQENSNEQFASVEEEQNTENYQDNYQSHENEIYEQFKDRLKDRQVKFRPDWIDISATSLGYEKHPLEQILEWLDIVMLWIEQICINIVYFWRGFLFGK